MVLDPTPLLVAAQLQLPGIDFGLFGLLNVVVAVIVGYFTYQDAKSRRTDSPKLWAGAMALASLLLNLIGFLLAFAVYYLVVIRD
ncbi:hypothetical protein Hbl1158_06150 [Halobaculum sp. CBA1158]|uniref:hypothetical protein n=1 Tax=Halobaculum sp. CBA1158 TaxID=2904243 RepID=UPI001F393FC3|nr:hypothetical protein [Halobaculum sp. CBA1158]UIP00937.1 hypothetical protein Hbl1158_06150 [Halobaculum sp. CBA1158]